MSIGLFTSLFAPIKKRFFPTKQDPALQEAADKRDQRVEMFLPEKFSLSGEATCRERWNTAIAKDSTNNSLTNVCFAILEANNKYDVAKHSEELGRVMAQMVDPAMRVATAILYGVDKTKKPEAVTVCIDTIGQNINKLKPGADRINAAAAMYHMAKTIGSDEKAGDILAKHYKTAPTGALQNLTRHPGCTL